MEKHSTVMEQGVWEGVDQNWITCLTSIFAPFVLIVTSPFLISPLEHSLRASAVMCTLHNVFIRCSFVDRFHWICVDRKPMRKESPFSRTVLLRIVFYEIRKTGNGPYSFNVFCNLSSSVISISYSRCSAGTAVNANVLVTNCPEDPVKNEIQSLIFFSLVIAWEWSEFHETVRAGEGVKGRDKKVLK